VISSYPIPALHGVCEHFFAGGCGSFGVHVKDDRDIRSRKLYLRDMKQISPEQELLSLALERVEGMTRCVTGGGDGSDSGKQQGFPAERFHFPCVHVGLDFG